MRKVVEHLQHLADTLEFADASDGQLLEIFVARRDESAFREIVRRHGPMVLGVCRRIVGDQHDADDAFQATFFVLARKADDIRPRDMVGNFLYGVAYRTALKARSLRTRRNAVERQVEHMPQLTAPPPEAWLELQPLLDQELNKLPDVYRTPIVLCDLEGRSRKEAAAQLAVPEGTLSSRLARGRQLLARRLGKRGMTLSATALAAVLAAATPATAVPPLLAASTVKTSVMLASGVATAIPASVAAIMQGALKSMLVSKVTTIASLIVASLFGMVALEHRDASPAVSPPAQAAIAAASDEEQLEGSWDVVSLEADGKPVALPPELKEQALTFQNGTMRTRLCQPDEGGQVTEATFTLGGSRLPKTIDIHFEGDQKSLGIYELEHNVLRICLAPASKGRPSVFKTSTDGADVLLILKPAESKG
jgi:RNA polymerase sigma-70 factor (ECF subfamily)